MAHQNLDEALLAFGDLASELGYPPSVRDLGARLGLSSTSPVQRRIAALRSKGLITSPHAAVRATVLTDRGRERYEALRTAQAVA
jgi:SOS-response transcriptional repressor LexA